MILLNSKLEFPNSRSVLVIGKGLIGSTIVNNLLLNGFNVSCQYTIRWNDQGSFNKAINQCLIKLQKNAKNNSLHIIWSAGKCGFGSTLNETMLEYEFFNECIQAIIKSIKASNTNTHFHFFSSAGGLYEGLINVSRSTPFNIMRPYGKLKINQEDILLEQKECFYLRIYRPSTVYGYYSENKRKGLIAALISNAIMNKETLIYGNYNTIRDYVWSEDIACFIRNVIIANRSSSDEVYTLASAMPLNILQIHKIIEKILNKKCLIRFASSPINTLHNSYSKNILPEGFNSSSIITNMSKIYYVGLGCIRT